MNMLISHELYKDEYEKASNEYTNGNISKKEFLSAVSNERKGQNDLKKSMYDILKAYEIYLSSVNGLAQASAG